MKVYNCMVNLGGPILHLAPKHGISAAEVHLLLHLFGNDSVRELAEVAEVNVSHGQLYDYLTTRYKPEIVEAKFGAKSRGLRLPDTVDLEAMLGGADGIDDEAEMMVDPTKAALKAVAINRGNVDDGNQPSVASSFAPPPVMTPVAPRQTLSLKTGANAPA